MIPEGYDLTNDEYVRKAELLSAKDIENHIEKNIVPFFIKLGFNIKKIPRTTRRTADYEYGELGIEVTSLQKYLPQNNMVDKLLKQYIETNSRICAYMFFKDDELRIEILDEQKLNNNVSILCLMQHISCYRQKLVGKINDKYRQDQDHNIQIIIIDFRLAHFDSLSLKKEIKLILGNLGMEYPSLGGILISLPKGIDSEMLDVESEYVFVPNTHCKANHEILNKLNNFSMATTSVWLTVNQIFINKPSDQSITITSPCYTCPGKNEIEMRGLPTL